MDIIGFSIARNAISTNNNKFNVYRSISDCVRIGIVPKHILNRYVMIILIYRDLLDLLNSVVCDLILCYRYIPTMFIIVCIVKDDAKVFDLRPLTILKR